MIKLELDKKTSEIEAFLDLGIWLASKCYASFIENIMLKI